MEQPNSNNQLSKEDKIIFELIKKGTDDNTSSPKFKRDLFAHLGQTYYPGQTSKKYRQKKTIFDILHSFFAFSAHFPAFVTAAFVLIIGFGFTSSYAYNNPNLTRQDNLYFLKRMVENLDYNLTISSESKVNKSIEFAERRKQELGQIYQTGQVDEVTAAEISKNLINAYQVSSQIENNDQKNKLEKKISNSSKEIVSQLNLLITDLEKTGTKKDKVYRVDPTIEEFKQTVQEIEKKVEEKPVITITPPPAQPKCQDECFQAGQNECFQNGFKTCGNFDQDSCLEWNQITACQSGQICQNGTCIQSCTDDCSAGQRTCQDNGNGYQICGNFDSDSCQEWGAVNYCPTGSSCSNGFCEQTQPVCSNDCSAGSRICTGNGFQICGNYDSDACTEWSSTQNCVSSQSCQNGYCITNQPACVDECTPDMRQCTSNGFQVCGNYDQDTCYEWGQEVACPSATRCENGACIESEPLCRDECFSDSERQCSSDKNFQICGNYDSDTCLEWGQQNECPYDQKCITGGVCGDSN